MVRSDMVCFSILSVLRQAHLSEQVPHEVILTKPVLPPDQQPVSIGPVGDLDQDKEESAIGVNDDGLQVLPSPRHAELCAAPPTA